MRTLFAVLFLITILPGCGSGPEKVTYARPYPAIAQSEVLNVQVVRGTTTIALTNTSARAFGPSTLWLNGRYSRPIDGLKVGQSMTLPMAEFRDEFQDAFRGGGFFASEPPERLVLAQIETPGEDGKERLLGLLVVGGDPE